MKFRFSGIKAVVLFTSAVLTPLVTWGQDDDQLGREGLNTITTAVPILLVSPDARAAALGETGVATSPDANSIHWNPAKLGFIQNQYGFSISHSPWLRNIGINDMSLNYLTGYYKVSERGTFSGAMRYFDLGDIQFSDDNGTLGQLISPKEYTFDVAYGQQLSENLSLGIGARFIHSNLTQGYDDSKAGNSGAVDVGVYYTKDLELGGRDYNLSLGGNISNIGAKIAYTNIDQKDFIPTNLRLGTAFTMNFDPYNKLTLAIDANKLLVPSPDPDTSTSTSDKSVITGIFSSFGDANGGFSEEMQEVSLSTGLEYVYNDLFAARVGYFYESPNKGNRHYLSLGLGLQYQRFGIDGAYLASNTSSPLANTLRFTLSFKFEE